MFIPQQSAPLDSLLTHVCLDLARTGFIETSSIDGGRAPPLVKSLHWQLHTLGLRLLLVIFTSWKTDIKTNALIKILLRYQCSHDMLLKTGPYKVGLLNKSFTGGYFSSVNNLNRFSIVGLLKSFLLSGHLIFHVAGKCIHILFL